MVNGPHLYSAFHHLHGKSEVFYDSLSFTHSLASFTTSCSCFHDTKTLSSSCLFSGIVHGKGGIALHACLPCCVFTLGRNAAGLSWCGYGDLVLELEPNESFIVLVVVALNGKTTFPGFPAGAPPLPAAPCCCRWKIQRRWKLLNARRHLEQLLHYSDKSQHSAGGGVRVCVRETIQKHKLWIFTQK